MKTETISWEKGAVRIIDQTRLPNEFVYLRLRSIEEVWEAIRQLKVRGAPVIGAAAALGLLLGIDPKKYPEYNRFRKRFKQVSQYLSSSRPTAVNLNWALKKMESVFNSCPSRNTREIYSLLEIKAVSILEEDRISCREMAAAGQKLIKDNDRILTYCNTGVLATVDYGTALGVIFKAKRSGKKLKVYACETRPLLQGARLTSWELARNKIDATLICDNMAGYLMQQGKIDKVFIGADRIAANGDAANKIGSYTMAVLARFHNIPFYVVAPRSTFDIRVKSGKDIPIEQRNPEEVRSLFYKKPMVARGVKIYNPAFDVVPHELISAIVTESTVLKPPFEKKIIRLLRRPDVTSGVGETSPVIYHGEPSLKSKK